MAGARATDNEIDKRIRSVMSMLRDRYRAWDICAVITKRYGISSRQAKRYVSHGRKRLLAEMGTTREEEKARTLDKLAELLNDPTASVRDKAFISREISKILGLYEPMVIHERGEHRHTHEVKVSYDVGWRGMETVDAGRN